MGATGRDAEERRCEALEVDGPVAGARDEEGFAVEAGEGWEGF